MDLRADFLVIGSGIAGLRAALSLADMGEVVILTKADPRESNTGYAQGGIAAALGPGDSPELHARDTIAAGDGLALAACAGACLTDLEFVQFHPTALNVEGAPRFLLSEALRGEGARLVNEAGEPFMERYEPAGDLAARDLVARAIVREAERTSAPVYLTLAHLDAAFVRRRFPTIAQACAHAGFDLARDRACRGAARHVAGRLPRGRRYARLRCRPAPHGLAGDRRLVHRARRATAAGEPRRAFSDRCSRARRSTLEEAHL